MLKFMIKGGIMNNKDVFELTNPQRNIWNTELFFSDTNINNICVSSIIDEVVDFNLLKKAINTLVELNESFRIKLCIENTIPMQYISDFMPFDIDIIELESMDKFKALEQSTVEEKFSLFDCNLFKFKLIKFSDGKGGIILNIHHIISDSWSLGLTIKEILKIYHCLKSGNDYISDTFPYSNLINSEKVYKSSNRYEEDKKFWNTYLENLSEPVTIPSINKKVNLTSSLAKRTSFIMEKDMVKKISDFCVQKKISNYSFFMSIFALYIANVSNSNDLILGTPILNRLNYKDKSTTGMFVTTMPFRFSLNNSDTFENFISNTSINLVSLLRHQKYPYSDIIDNIRDNDTDTPNLYNIAISYQITKAVSKDIGNYETHWVFNNNCLNDMNIHLYDANNTGKIEIDYDYLSEKYTEEEIKANHARILHMINQVLKNPSILLSDIEVITPEEKEKILNDFNNRTLACPFEKNIIKLFEEQVEKNPNNNALIYKDEKFTYSELNQIVNKLARFLKNKNIQKNDIVGVYMNKNSWFIISILAIQKLGAAYLPMHPDYPEDRVNYILQDSNTKLLLTDQDFLNNICETINPSKLELDNFDDCNLNIDFSSDNLCYVIYTSGSTGKPKGVLLTHYNLINFLYNFNDCFDKKFSPEDNCLSVTNISFDVSVCEIFTPLIFGSTLILYTKNTLTDIPLLCNILDEHNITFMYIPPNILNDVFNFISLYKKNFCINKMLVGVEPIKNETLNNFYKLNNNIEIINGYGPTEATICSTFFKYICNAQPKDIVPIGYTLKNNKILILNKFNNIQPIAFPGELCISGKNVSIGYLNNDEINKKAFIHISNITNLPIYKTGDIAYWLEDGCISFIGRQDSQVKFRGHRIELTEINKTIKNIEGITNSYTLIKDVNKIPCICSYISVNSNSISEDIIKDKLNDELPYYMIPTYIIFLEKMPLTLNGKIDYKNLPEIVVTSTNHMKASTPTQKKLHAIICNLLNLKKISIDDDFFAFGMDSLMAIRLTLEIYHEFNKNVNIHQLFKYNTILTLSSFLDNINRKEDLYKIKISEKKDNYQLSSAQKRIYYATKMSGDDSLLYNISGGFIIDEILDKNKVEAIFNKIIEQNSSFRTYFRLVNGEPRQFILDECKISINSINDGIKSKDDIQEIIDNYPKFFDLDFAPLLRVELHYINTSTLILIDSHHIILDGTSLNILMNDFCKLYNDENIINKEISYTDYSEWENNYLNSTNFIAVQDYWKNRFNNYEIPVINLPYDNSINNSKTFTGNKLSFKLTKTLFRQLSKLSKKYDCSNYMIFLTALYILLYKYTGQSNIIIGSPIESRNSIQLKNIIGMFVNNIALNLTIDDNISIKQLLSNVKSLVLNSLTNQPYPYDSLLKDLNISSSSSLFDVVLTYQNENKENPEINGHSFKILPANNKTSKFNLSLEILPNLYTLNIEYNTDLFRRETIESLFSHYKFILQQLLSNINTSIDNIEIITPKEEKLLNKFNNTYSEINDDTVVSIFEKIVAENPNNTALICDDKKLSYIELNKKANSLAHHLINMGIKPNDIVCIMTNRSLETIVCMLGILKAGAAFLNVDPTYPIERTQYYLSDCKAQYVLTQHCLKDTVKSIKNCIEIDLNNSFYNSNFDNPNIKVQPQDLSYVIYTSGSTGTPKGVMLNQIGFANMSKAMSKVLDYLKEGNKHCLVSVTSTPFDIFVYEIIVSLTHGLKVLMANNSEHRNPVLLDKLIQKYHADVMTVTPSLMKINYDNRQTPSALSNIKHMVFGGEPLPEKFVQDLRELSPNVTIYNIYGPSEITILSNVQNLNNENRITIGPPIMNTQIHILDKFGKRVPIGVVGEIYISGIQVGLGYLGKPEMTNQKFLPNKFGTGKMYKSGDIGRWTFDGKVQCLGRIDNQIKLRGLRIELGEIENKMESINGVLSSVVNKFEHDGREFLCGYYVADKDVLEQDVKNYLRSTLPYYMVPTYIMRLDKMPYTINRKIDRKALPVPNTNTNVITNANKQQRELSENEKKLLNIWKKILKLDNISIYDNFFDIGGDSISAINMQIEAIKDGFSFEYADIFNFPTIENLSKKIPSIFDNSISNYDYSNIEPLLQKNNLSNLNTIKKIDIGNILLIGGTGYLGAHIINNFLTTQTGHIYCLVRQKNNMIPYERLKNILDFYFGNNFFDTYKNRIHIFEGDITKEQLDLSNENYNIFKNNINIVLNSGALVKHFGQKNLFEEINVKGTQNIIDLCKTTNKRLIHISTISVSGNGEKEESIIENMSNLNSKQPFYENSLYVGQNLKGIYTITKFKAEKLILDSILDGLNAQILRIGNITNRYSDGVFQRNLEENAFAQRIRAFINLGVFPEYALQHQIELTPVDLCADAIVKIMNYESDCNILHIYNNKLLPINLLVNTLNEMNIKLIPVSDKKMTEIINSSLNDDSKKDILSGIIHDLDKDKRLIYTSRIKLDCTFTEKYLEKVGFHWKNIDKDYIIKYINYFKNINFID